MFNMLNEIVNYTNWVKSEPGGGNSNGETCAVLTDQGINIKKKKHLQKRCKFLYRKTTEDGEGIKINTKYKNVQNRTLVILFYSVVEYLTQFFRHYIQCMTMQLFVVFM